MNVIAYLLLGFSIGLVVGTAFEEYSYKKYLELKALKIGRTPAYIRKKFYYIVPEKEYLNLK